MHRYWEAGHFKKSLGDLLLARMFNAIAASAQWGIRLTGEALPEHLFRQRLARDEHESTHAKDMSELVAFVTAAMPGP